MSIWVQSFFCICIFYNDCLCRACFNCCHDLIHSCSFLINYWRFWIWMAFFVYFEDVWCENLTTTTTYTQTFVYIYKDIWLVFGSLALSNSPFFPSGLTRALYSSQKFFSYSFQKLGSPSSNSLVYLLQSCSGIFWSFGAPHCDFFLKLFLGFVFEVW